MHAAAAKRHFDRSEIGRTTQILDDLVAAGVADAGILYLRGRAFAMLGAPGCALADLEATVDLTPKDVAPRIAAADACRTLGRMADSRHHLLAALAIDPEHEVAHDMLSTLDLSGEHCYPLMARVIGHIRPRTYLEIGVKFGRSLRLATPPTLAIGVDPSPRIEAPLFATQRVVAETSDAFFANHDVRAEFGGLPVDLAFIDGMHHFEYALRDFINIERHCLPGSTILLHDCYPPNPRAAVRDGDPRKGWSGDVWRLVLALREHRPDLAVHTIGAPPTGLGVIRALDPGSRVLEDNLDDIVARYMNVDLSAIAASKAESLNLVPNEWERVRELLDVPPALDSSRR